MFRMTTVALLTKISVRIAAVACCIGRRPSVHPSCQITAGARHRQTRARRVIAQPFTIAGRMTRSASSAAMTAGRPVGV